MRTELQQTHPGIQISLVSPGVVRTDFGLNARHGGVDSRHLPDSQSAEEVAAVVVNVIETRRPDVCHAEPGRKNALPNTSRRWAKIHRRSERSQRGWT